jgi:hypothetical protein
MPTRDVWKFNPLTNFDSTNFWSVPALHSKNDEKIPNYNHSSQLMRPDPMKESVISSLKGDRYRMDCERERGIIWKRDVTSWRGEMQGEETGKGD